MIRLIFALAILPAISSPLLGDINVTFGPSKEIPAAITKAIDEAVWTIDIAIYSLTDNRLVKRIEQAAKDGLTIRVLLDKPTKSSKIVDRLEVAGADVRSVNISMHHKFCIADRKLLLTGSGNWSQTSFNRYDEDLLQFVDEPNYVNSFQGEFDKLWHCSKEYGNKIIKSPKSLRVPQGFKRVAFTTDNMIEVNYQGRRIFRSKAELEDGICGKILLDAIGKAETSIKIATTHFRRKDIADALQEAMKRGVKVQMLLDQQEYHRADQEMADVHFDEELANNGVDVRYKCYTNDWTYQRALQMHCKYMIVDNRTVLTGSLNWSSNSELKSIENLIVLDRPQVTKQYLARFKMKWNYGRGTLPEVRQQLKDPSEDPIGFKPISLTGSQIENVLSPSN